MNRRVVVVVVVAAVVVAVLAAEPVDPDPTTAPPTPRDEHVRAAVDGVPRVSRRDGALHELDPDRVQTRPVELKGVS
eukprot:30746-Pelagococcus_subviridis.AAC.3